MTSHDEQRLSDALRRQAESTDPHLLTLDDVTGRARGIRRRRMAAGVVAAAAVVAVVVPTALVAADRDDRSTPDRFATQTPNATASLDPTQTPTATPPRRAVEVPIGGDLSVGAAPAVPISIQGSVLTTAGQRIEFGDELTYFAQVGEAYAGIVRTSDTGEAEFQVRTADGEVVTKAPANVDGALTVTPDRTAVAYVGTDQRIHTWTDSDNDLTFSAELPNIRLVGMTNAEPGTCKEPEPEGPGCTVVFARGEGGAGYATSHGIVDDIAGFTTVNDANDGVLAGQNRSTTEGSCNEVRLGFDGKALWKTCNASPINLSPGNEHVTALPAYFDGMCCSTYSVFDVAAGKKVLEVTVESNRQNPGYIPMMGWEDDTHLLAIAYTGKEWRVVRVGLDGSAEIADAGKLPTTDLGEVPVRTPVGS
jgi:hypothetical protein